MGVVLYRAGESHTVNGIKVEAKIFDAYLFDSNLQAGWSLTPEEAYDIPEEVIEAPEDEEQPTYEEVDTNGSGKLSNKEIRTAAERMGFDDYDTARISTLKERMGL